MSLSYMLSQFQLYLCNFLVYPILLSLSFKLSKSVQYLLELFNFAHAFHFFFSIPYLIFLHAIFSTSLFLCVFFFRWVYKISIVVLFISYDFLLKFLKFTFSWFIIVCHFITYVLCCYHYLQVIILLEVSKLLFILWHFFCYRFSNILFIFYCYCLYSLCSLLFSDTIFFLTSYYLYCWSIGQCCFWYEFSTE